jgi:hypothetical protein
MPDYWNGGILERCMEHPILLYSNILLTRLGQSQLEALTRSCYVNFVVC